MLCVAAACGGPGASDPGWTAALDQLHGAIVSSTGYPAGSVEVTGSMDRVKVMISDRELARADRDHADVVLPPRTGFNFRRRSCLLADDGEFPIVA